jgi:hypothetical protein
MKTLPVFADAILNLWHMHESVGIGINIIVFLGRENLW